jgi:guanylate kinase
MTPVTPDQEMRMPEETLSFDLVHPQPLMVVISGPSGVGKDAVVKELQQRNHALHFVVTMTTRLPRNGEQDGVDYFFVSKEQFEEKIRSNGFIEHALVYQDYKGIPRDQIQMAFDSGRDVILRVDVQGAKTLRGLFPEALLIFLIPSNVNEWYERLLGRQTETKEALTLRLDTAKEELEQLSEFDYVVVNVQGHLDDTVETIAAILCAEHHRVQPRKVEL